MARLQSKFANGFLEQLGNVNTGSARTVSVHLADFEQFVGEEYRKDLDSLVEELRSTKVDLYELFSKFVTYEVREKVQKNFISPKTLNQRVKHIKHFLEALSNFVNAFAINVTEAIPALMIIIAIATVRAGRNRSPLLKFEEMMRAVDWNIVMLFGGGLALGMGMEAMASLTR